MPRDGVAITWTVPYSWEQSTPATYLDPAEGGIELGEVFPIAIEWFPENAEDAIVEDIAEGSILDILIVKKYGTPSDGECWAAAETDCEFAS